MISIHSLLVAFLGAVLACQAVALAQATPPSGAAQPPAAQPAATPTEEPSGSLFTPTWHEVLIGGRFSNIDGDPARFQRYQDMRDGFLVSGFRYATADKDGAWSIRGTADHVGYRDQRYWADFDKTGKFTIRGLYDQIPQFYSVDTRTAYTRNGATLTLDDAAQRSAQSGGGLNVYLPISPQFDLRERRDIGSVNFRATPTQTLDLTANFTTQRHRGELPWGASFGFGNDVEVPLPYDSRANDFNLGAEWSNMRNMLRVAYAGSWFDNLDDTLVWDNPLRFDDSTSAPGRGRTALWPSNTAQTISVAGYSKMAHKTQVTGQLSFGFWSNDEPLQPFTINSALPQLALPRPTAQADANVISTNVGVVSHPLEPWRFSAKVRRYDYNNETPHTAIPQFINYDTSVATSATGGPENFAHAQTTFDADATYTGLGRLALNAGYTRNDNSWDFRIFESSGENVLRLSADAVGTPWATFRAQYEVGSRSGSGLDEDLLREIGEQPRLRHYDIADRTRNRFTGQVDIVPNDMWMFSASTGVGKYDYSESALGLQEFTVKTFGLSVDYKSPKGFCAGVIYNYEQYQGLQQSHEGDNSDAQFNDPKRDWTADTDEHVNYFSLYFSPPRFGQAEVRLSYDYSFAEGTNVYAVPAGSPIPAPNQLPNVFNKLQQLHLDGRYRLSSRLAASISYLYEPFRVYDYAFDSSVVNSIVQPSSLVMGYIYRPYTAHSFIAGLRVYW
jgi:MtrB/PioB family decaheme-associated outer membrane protein